VADEERRRRFVHEARAASAVSHPAIAHLYEIDDEGGTIFIAMEFIEGSTLRQLVARGEIDLASAIEIAIQVADALARAHEAGIVHRDIKSDNIMVTRDGHPKILDFGLAKLIGGPEGGSSSGSSGGGGGGGASVLDTATLTRTGMIMGTVAYMSPEQARGLPADRRSDVFSFGIVLFEMVTGKLPFKGVSPLDTMHSLAFEPAPPVTTLRADLPWSLQRVIDRCLQKKPDDRYQDMREAVTELKAVKREIDSGVSGGVPLKEKMRWYLRGLSLRGFAWLALAVPALALFAALWLASSRGASFSGLLMIAGLGALLFRRFRNRGQREIRRFVKKASAMREVKLVSFSNGRFTVVTSGPSARTYVRLNAQLSSANERLFHGEPMTMVVLESVEQEELRRMLSSPGIQFVREDVAMRPLARPAGSGP